MSKTVDDARSLIEQRLREVEDEARRLEAALPYLTRKRRRTRRPSQGGGERKRALPGQRRREFLDAVAAQPGVTVSEFAKKLGIAAAPIYAVARAALDEKVVRKNGPGYEIVASTSQPKRKKGRPKAAAKAKARG